MHNAAVLASAAARASMDGITEAMAVAAATATWGDIGAVIRVGTQGAMVVDIPVDILAAEVMAGAAARAAPNNI